MSVIVEDSVVQLLIPLLAHFFLSFPTLYDSKAFLLFRLVFLIWKSHLFEFRKFQFVLHSEFKLDVKQQQRRIEQFVQSKAIKHCLNDLEQIQALIKTLKTKINWH